MQVVMKKDELLAILEKNRQEHAAIFEEAQNGYLARVAEALAEVQKIFTDTQELNTHPLELVKPQSFDANYEEAIEMVKHTQEDLITLPHAEFRQYVLDKWQWTNQFAYSNSVYVSQSTSETISKKLK